MAKLEKGTQIIYIPTHAKGDKNHPDCENGFVTSVQGDSAFCRYWSKQDSTKLRTKANSELTSIRDLVVWETTPKHLVNDALIIIERT